MESQINMNRHLINDLIRQRECLTVWIERLKATNEKLEELEEQEKRKIDSDRPMIDPKVNQAIREQKIELILNELLKVMEDGN